MLPSTLFMAEVRISLTFAESLLEFTRNLACYDLRASRTQSCLQALGVGCMTAILGVDDLLFLYQRRKYLVVGVKGIPLDFLSLTRCLYCCTPVLSFVSHAWTQ